jgi:hypothetical protein
VVIAVLIFLAVTGGHEETMLGRSRCVGWGSAQRRNGIGLAEQASEPLASDADVNGDPLDVRSEGRGVGLRPAAQRQVRERPRSAAKPVGEPRLVELVALLVGSEVASDK